MPSFTSTSAVTSAVTSAAGSQTRRTELVYAASVLIAGLLLLFTVV